MKNKLLSCFLLLLCLSIKSSAQEQISHLDNSGYANLFLYYPLDKSAIPFSIFINKKNIGKITNGGRVECKLLLEGPVAITLIEGLVYKEPLTQSKNSRTISISKGKSYYFRVSGNGSLDYTLSAEKGQSHFADSKDFISPPVPFVEAPGSGIPTLQSKNN